MNSRFFGCGKFQRLREELEERALSAKDLAFMEKHRAVCGSCQRHEGSFAASLDMLRSLTLQPEVEPNYDERLMRRIQVLRKRERMSYWFPALVGAGIASVAIFALVQLITGPTQVHPLLGGSQEANRSAHEPVREPRLLLPVETR